MGRWIKAAAVMVAIGAVASCGSDDADSETTEASVPATESVSSTAPADTTAATDAAPADTAPADTAGLDDTVATSDPAAGGVTVDENGLLVQAECVGDNVAAESDGVTADTANVSVLSIDFAPLAEIGFASSDRDPTGVYAEFANEINENGGVCGRTLDVQQVKFNILAGEGGQACLEATEDRENLIIATTGYSEVLCLTDAGVPVVAGNDSSSETMDASNDLLLIRPPLLDKQFEATTQYALDAGALDGVVGVWYGGVYPDQNAAVERVVLPMLDAAGVDYTAFRNDSVGPSDPEGNAVLTAAASEFASKNIDTLLQFVQNTNQTGMQLELDALGVSPRYISMPISGNSSNELFAERFGTREIADGQEYVTYTRGATEADASDPMAVACHEIWTRRTGEVIEPNSFDYAAIVGSCSSLFELAAAMSVAGGELNRESIIAGYENLPPHKVGGQLGETAWTADNHVGPNVFSVQIYDGGTNTVATQPDTFTVGD
jgi:hypothetical protein